MLMQLTATGNPTLKVLYVCVGNPMLKVLKRRILKTKFFEVETKGVGQNTKGTKSNLIFQYMDPKISCQFFSPDTFKLLLGFPIYLYIF